MSLKNLILNIVQIAIFFIFPTIWYWLMAHIPWWPLDPQTTLGIVTGLAVIIVSWLLGLLKIRSLANQLKVRGLIL